MKVSWDSLHAEIEACDKCDLCRRIHHKVPGQGDGNADLMFIGEGPGADEDMQGLAFVGAAGQLLTRMIAAIGMTREQGYICNVVKCRPPQNRVPTPAAGRDRCPRGAGRPGSHYPRSRKLGRTQGRLVHTHLSPRRPPAGRKQKARRLARFAGGAAETDGSRHHG